MDIDASFLRIFGADLRALTAPEGRLRLSVEVQVRLSGVPLPRQRDVMPFVVNPVRTVLFFRDLSEHFIAFAVLARAFLHCPAETTRGAHSLRSTAENYVRSS